MRKQLIKSLALAAVGSLFIAGSALATPLLLVSAGSDVVILNDLIDLTGTPGDGILFYAGAIGDTSLTFSIATSYPQTGAIDYPNLHLTAFVTGGTDLVTFAFTDTFLSLDPGIEGWETQFGGANSGAVTFDAFLNGTSIAHYTDFGPDQISSFVPGAGPFKFDLIGTIQAVPAGSTSFDANVNPVPEPATMLLFGAGLAGLAGLRRKKS